MHLSTLILKLEMTFFVIRNSFRDETNAQSDPIQRPRLSVELEVSTIGPHHTLSRAKTASFLKQ